MVPRIVIICMIDPFSQKEDLIQKFPDSKQAWIVSVEDRQRNQSDIKQLHASTEQSVFKSKITGIFAVGPE